MRKLLSLATAVTLLVSAATGEAQARHGRRGTPIMASDPSIRVTRSGDVVSPHRHLSRRVLNGRVPLHPRR